MGCVSSPITDLVVSEVSFGTICCLFCMNSSVTNIIFSFDACAVLDD